MPGLTPSLRRLPPEILSYIARHIPDEDATNAKSIIPMTHVCRFWRESIISAPENWSRISNGSIGFARLSLERCKKTSMELFIDFHELRNTPGFSDLITPCVQNIKILRICSISTEEKFAQTLPKFLQSMPNLRSLALAGMGLSDRPNDLCEPITSNLTHLSLEGTPLYSSFLGLTTLTDLTISDSTFELHLDTLLDLLEKNHSLENLTLSTPFSQHSLQNSQRSVSTKTRIRRLSIWSGCVMGCKELVSKIAVQKGGHLELGLFDWSAKMNDIHSVVSVVPLLHLCSPTSMRYCPHEGTTRLLGPHESFSLKLVPGLAPLAELCLLPLDNIRTFHLISLGPVSKPPHPMFPSSYFPALETLVIEHNNALSDLLSDLFLNPSYLPSLKTLAFLNCDISEGFVGKLIGFSSDRKEATSLRLHRVIIIDSGGILPSSILIDKLGEHVPVVEAFVGRELPSDLKWDALVG